MAEPTITQLVDTLIEEMGKQGDIGEVDRSVFLDSLACAGLTLKVDTEMEASNAWIAEIQAATS